MSFNLSNHSVLNGYTCVELEEVFPAIFQILDVKLLSCSNGVIRIIRKLTAINEDKIISQGNFCFA